MLRDRDALAAGAVLIAPAGQRPLVGRKRVDLPDDATATATWSAADALFESAARAFGPHLLAVALGGAGNHGLTGLRKVKDEGGSVLALDPERSHAPTLANESIREGLVDAALDTVELGIEILRAATSQAEPSETGRHRVR